MMADTVCCCGHSWYMHDGGNGSCKIELCGCRSFRKSGGGWVNPMVAAHGAKDGFTCATCRHLLARKYTRWVYKCARFKVTSSPATDIRRHGQACALYEPVSIHDDKVHDDGRDL